MRQHITEEQLKELTDLQRQALLNYTEEKGWYPQFTRPTLMLHTFDKYLSECIGIGKMIEFLDEHKKGWVITRPYQEENDQRIRLGYLNYIFIKEELCDALWEAVKEVV